MINRAAIALLVVMFLMGSSFESSAQTPPDSVRPDIPVSLTDEERAWLASHQSMRIAGPKAFPPFHFYDDRGVALGIASDYLDLITRFLNIKIETKAGLSWPDVLKKAEGKEIDLIPLCARSVEREKFLIFTSPFLSYPLVIVTRINAPFVAGIKELHGKKIALIKGNATHDWMVRDKIDFIPHFVDTPLDALKAVSLGKAEAAIENLAAATHLIQSGGLANLKIAAPTPYGQYELYMAVRKDWPELALIFNKVLAAIPPAQHDEIRNRWLSVRYEHGIQKSDIVKWVALVGAVLLTVMAIFLLWSWKLKKEIEDRRLAEDALRESRDLFGLFMKHSPIYTFIKEIDGDRTRVLELSDNFIGMVGIPAAEMRGRTMEEIFPADFARKITEDDLAVISRGDVLTLEESLNGLEYITIKFPILREGQPSLLAGFTIDITDRKRAEQELRLSEQKYFSVFNLMPDMVGITRSSDGCFIEVNTGFERWSGWTREEVIGKSSLDIRLWTPEARAEALAIITREGRLDEFNFMLRTKSGEQRNALMYLLPIAVDGESCLYFVARDITDSIQAEEQRLTMEKQLLHAQKLESLGVLAGGIAHDFNNILTAIIGNAELALMRLNPESPALENLERIEKAAARASDLARQMLAYSGKGRFIIETIDLNRLVEEMFHMLTVSISKKAVLRINPYHPLPAVEADATQMRQIVMNLVINASEAIGDKSGIIAVTTGVMDCDPNYLKDVWLDENISEGLYVYLEIADSGCGMDKDIQSKLFDPFFTTKFTGRGLGMAAVLGIVRSHKGAIKVYSEPNKGATFKILLPASSRPAELFDDTSHTDWQGKGIILLVDDEETVRGIGKEMLRELGFKVITANDGREAVETYKRHPDIVMAIVDLTMPHMDGEQCFRELRHINPEFKVIISSGYNEQEVTEKFAGKGLAGFIQKPYKLSTLKEKLRKL